MWNILITFKSFSIYCILVYSCVRLWQCLPSHLLIQANEYSIFNISVHVLEWVRRILWWGYEISCILMLLNELFEMYSWGITCGKIKLGCKFTNWSRTKLWSALKKHKHTLCIRLHGIKRKWNKWMNIFIFSCLEYSFIHSIPFHSLIDLLFDLLSVDLFWRKI